LARMVDVGGKKDVRRRAVATGEIMLRSATLRAIAAGKLPKGDALGAAEVAALQAIKRTWEVLPHCHQIPITSASVKLELGRGRVTARVEVEATYKTGVEMEALYGVSVALLTVWDVVKSLEKDWKGGYPATAIENVRVIMKVKNHG